MEKTSIRDAEQAARKKKVAEICGVSVRTVERVIEGTQNNENVFSTYMWFAQEENKLMQVARALVPFN